MEEVKPGAESTHGSRSRSRTKSTKRCWNFNTKDSVVPVYKRRKVARKKCSKHHVKESRCVVEDGRNQIKCCYVVLERLTEDLTKPNFRQQQKPDTVEISEEQCDVQHLNNINLESSNVIADGNDIDQIHSDFDETCLIHHDELFEDELTKTDTYQVDGVVLYSEHEHLTAQCEVAVSKMRDILKHGSKPKHDAYRHPQYDSNQIKQHEETQSITQACTDLFEEGKLSDVQFHVDKIGKKDSNANPINQVKKIPNEHHYSVTVQSQFNAQKIRQYNAHSKRKSQCQSDSDTSAGKRRQEHIVSGQQTLSEPASHGTKQTASHGTKQAASHGTKQAASHGTKQTASHGTKQAASHGTKQAVSHDTKQAASHGTKQAASHGTKQAVSHGTKQAASLGTKQAASHGTKQAASHGTKQTGNTKLTSKVTADKWTFSKHEIEEQERAQSIIDAVQINECMFQVQTPDETDHEASAQNIEVDQPCENDTHWTGRLSTLAAWRGRGSRKGVSKPPVSAVKAADEAELVYRFWPEDAKEVYRKEKAMSYLSDVRTTYRQSPQIYNMFVDLVRSLKATKRPTRDIRQQVCKLFEENPHLIRGFNMFLPTDTTQEYLNNKLVSQPTKKNTLGPGTYSTYNSIAETSAKQAHPLATNVVKNTRYIVSSPLVNPKKSPSEDIRNVTSSTMEGPMTSFLNIPNVYQESMSQMSTSEISMGSNHPLGYTFIAVPPMPVERSRSLCDVNSVPCATAMSKDSSANPGPMTMLITLPVCIPSSQSLGSAGDLQLEERLSEGLHESRQFPQATKEGISQPSEQITSQPTQIDELPINEPTTQVFAKVMTDTTNPLQAEAAMQESSYNDIAHGTETHSQTRILIGSEAEAGTERGWGAEGESQRKNQLEIEAASETTRGSVTEKQLRIELKSQTETQQATTSQTENLTGTDEVSETENQSRMEAMSYLTAVKTAYMQSPHTYNKFVDLVRSLKETKKPTEGIRQEICKLFEDKPHLITGFNMFLPADTTQGICDEPGVNEGYLTKFQNKLVTHHVNHPMVNNTQGPMTGSTIHSVGETSTHLMKNTLSYPASGTMAENTSKVVNSPWLNQPKCHSEKIRNIHGPTFDEQIRSILNIPIVYPKSKSMINASEISMGCPKTQASIHPTEYTVMAVPPVCDDDSLACAASRSMDSSALDSDHLPTKLTSHPAIDTMSVDDTYTVKEGAKPFVLKFSNEGTDKQEMKQLRDAYTSSFPQFPQFPQATKEDISQPSVQITSHPTQIDELPISEPTIQIIAETVTDTTNQLNAETLIQHSSNNDKEQRAPAQSETEIFEGSEAASGTGIKWGTEKEAQTEKLEAASSLFFFSQTVKVSAMEEAPHTVKHTGTELESQTKNHQEMGSEAQKDIQMGTEVELQTESHQGAKGALQTDSHHGAEVQLQTESHQGEEAELQTESHQGAEAELQTEPESQMDNYVGMETQPQTNNQMGTEVELQTESHQGAETELQTEPESQMDNYVGMETQPQTDNQMGTEVELQTESQEGAEAVLQTESHQEAEAELQTESHQGADAESQTESHQGEDAELQTEPESQMDNYVGMETQSQTDNEMGTEVVLQTESHQRAKADLQTESHQRAEVESQNGTHRGENVKPQTEKVLATECIEAEAKVENKCHQEAEAESETENYLAIQAASPTKKVLGTEVESQTETPLKAEEISQTESHQGAVAESQTESHIAMEAESQTENGLGTEVEAQTKNVLGTEVESQTEKVLGSEVESQTEKVLGTEVESQTEKLLGTEVESQTEKLLGTEVESQTEKVLGTEVESQTEKVLGTEVESQTEKLLGTEVESQTEKVLGTEVESQTEKVLGTEVESQTEKLLGTEVESQTEKVLGTEVESQTEKVLGTAVESQTENVLGTEVESQTEKVLGTEAESQTESHQGAEAESQTEHQQRVEAEAQTEKLLGSETESQTESQLGIEVESQTENGQGKDTAFQTENQARAELERQIKVDQQILMPNAEPSASNMESQNVDPVYVDEEKALSHVLETNNLVTRQMVRQMETEAKSTQVLTGERSVNKVTLLGRVGRPAEMRGTADYPVTVFPLATSISIKRDDGTYEQQTEWHRISIFRKGLRDIAAASITTGDRVFVSGAIKYGSFEQDGRTVYSTSIIADDVIRLTGKKPAQSSSEASSEASGTE